MNLQETINYFISAMKTSIIIFSFTIGVIVSYLETIFIRLFSQLSDTYTSETNIISLVAFYIILSFAATLTFLDFITGISKTKKKDRKNGIIKSSGWSLTLAKYLGIFLLASFGTLLILITNSSMFILISVYTFAFMLSGVETQSIGENIEEKYGKKPAFFHIFDKIFLIIENKFYEFLIKKLFGWMPKQEDESFSLEETEIIQQEYNPIIEKKEIDEKKENIIEKKEIDEKKEKENQKLLEAYFKYKKEKNVR